MDQPYVSLEPVVLSAVEAKTRRVLDSGAAARFSVLPRYSGASAGGVSSVGVVVGVGMDGAQLLFLSVLERVVARASSARSSAVDAQSGAAWLRSDGMSRCDTIGLQRVWYWPRLVVAGVRSGAPEQWQCEPGELLLPALLLLPPSGNSSAAHGVA